MWTQKTIELQPRTRGFHLITSEIEEKIPELAKFHVGLCHIFVHHTSASLTVNENADPSVRKDFEAFFRQSVPDNLPVYTHTMEGSDDMPGHIKSSILGSSVTVPVSKGRLLLGTWQGIYLGEHRSQGGSRKITITINGE